MRRLFDTIFALSCLLLLWPLMLGIALLIRFTSPGPVLYWSDRVGIGNTTFAMPKFRTMSVDAPIVASHLMTRPLQFVTPVGKFLRRWSLDELPQIYSILRGDLAVVGPRPALFNQYDLIELRTQAHVHTVRPGLTGWAQVNGRDEVSLAQKVALDRYYIEHRGLMLDLKILLLTAVKVLTKDGITH